MGTTLCCTLYMSLDPQHYSHVSDGDTEAGFHSCQVGGRIKLRPSNSKVHVVFYAVGGSVNGYGYFGGQFGNI